MATVTTMSGLLKELDRIKTEVMKKDVSERATKLMEDNIDTEVYEAYTPMGDTRTGALGESVEADMQDNDTLVVYNSRYDYGYGGMGFRDVGRVVETGKGYYSNALDKRIGARPFIEVTREALEKGEFKKAMIEGLAKRGIKAE